MSISIYARSPSALRAAGGIVLITGAFSEKLICSSISSLSNACSRHMGDIGILEGEMGGLSERLIATAGTVEGGYDDGYDGATMGTTV